MGFKDEKSAIQEDTHPYQLSITLVVVDNHYPSIMPLVLVFLRNWGVFFFYEFGSLGV